MPQMTQGLTATIFPLSTPSSTLIPATPTTHETQVSSETPTSATETLVQTTIHPTKALDADPGAIIIDHTSIALFEKIPEAYLTAAREMNMLFSDRSVGQNINEGLDCLAAPSWDRSPASCRRDYYNAEWNWKTFRGVDRSGGSVPSRILFDPSPTKYNRDNWIFEFKGGGWSELTQDFIEVLGPEFAGKMDVLSYQLTYLNVTESDEIADPERGYFADNPDRYDIFDLEAYILKRPNNIFFFWTTSLARSIGSETAVEFNNQMRRYSLQQGKILFDVADIESHTPDGTPCYDNRDGIEYCSQTGKCENYPDDGKDIPAICQDYTTETDGGHLGSVSMGKIQIAKGFWVLMARIAGWDGEIQEYSIE